jgi:hypothetical protein
MTPVPQNPPSPPSPPGSPDPPGRSALAAGGSGDASFFGSLYAWLYDVDDDGKSRTMMPGNQPLVTAVGAILRVSAEGGQNTPTERYLKVPKAEGMASEPVTVSLDKRTGYWVIRNSGHTNTLRLQQYGLAATPLYPGASMPMSGEDVAVWIPVVPTRSRANQKSEAFRLLILATKEPPHPIRSGGTLLITVPRRTLTKSQQEALIAYFGDHLSWPPLPAPHVRKQSEVADMAGRYGLAKEQNWARNRHDVLAGRDGLFTAADWYPKLGGHDRTIGDHLAAFCRLVELRTITRARATRWAKSHDVQPYVIFDQYLTITE